MSVQPPPSSPLRERARQAFEARRANPRLQVAFLAVRRDMQAGGELLAGALAMRLFILMLPFVAVLLATLGLVTRSDPETAREALQGTGIASTAAASLTESARLSSGSMWAVLAGALGALVLGARTTLRVLWAVHLLAWRQTPRRPPHPWGGAGLVIAGTLLIVGVMLLPPVARHELGPAAGLLGTAVLFALEVGFWLGAAWLLPHGQAPWRALLPGAVMTAVGVTILHSATALWAAGVVSHYNAAYGALGTAVALLLWFYVLGRVIVAATMLSAARWEQHAA